MDISSIRAKARQVKKDTRGIHMLFLVPILANIISITYNFSRNRGFQSSGSSYSAAESALQYLNIPGLIITTLSAVIFTTIIAILLEMFTTSARFKVLDVLREGNDEVSFKDSLRAFNGDIFGKVFSTIFLKNVLLFLWGLISSFGSVLMLAGFIGLIYSSLIGVPSDTASSTFYLGLLIAVVGLVIAIPQAYAYSQTEYILYDKLKNNEYTSAFSIIKESRKIMKGFKLKRFILDLTFIGWALLSSITFGLVGIHVIPYRNIAESIFYEELRQGTIE